MGLWILQQCRATWEAEGETYSYAQLVDMAVKAKPMVAIFNPNDPAFLTPGDHPQRIRDWCRKTNQPFLETPGDIVRSVLESLALAYRQVLEQITAVTNRRVTVLHIVGGGSQNRLLNQMTADATGLPVIAGPSEATVIGNALVQLITLGEISDLRQARQIEASMTDLKIYEPGVYAGLQASDWDEVYARFQALQLSLADES